MKNRYIIRSRISERKFRGVVKLFSLDIEAKKAAKLTGISRPTINKIYDKIRDRIAQDCEANSLIGKGEIELDESYFGAKRVSGKRGRGTKGKTAVFGMLKRNGKVYTQIIKNRSLPEILPVIAAKESTRYTDGFPTYDGLAGFGYKKHCRIKHRGNEFAKGRNPISEIENFWGFFKARLARFRGIHKHKFYHHLKECEWRYNNRENNLYIWLLNTIRNNPLKLS